MKNCSCACCVEIEKMDITEEEKIKIFEGSHFINQKEEAYDPAESLRYRYKRIGSKLMQQKIGGTP